MKHLLCKTCLNVFYVIYIIHFKNVFYVIYIIHFKNVCYVIYIIHFLMYFMSSILYILKMYFMSFILYISFLREQWLWPWSYGSFYISTKCCWFLFRLMSFFISIFFRENLNYTRHWQKLMREQRTITLVDIVDVNLTTIQWRPGQSLYIRTLKLFHFHLE